MNYLKHYCALIRRAENRNVPECYVEKHHTFPKSIFGANNRLVSLTAREHYVAHLLLWQIYKQRYGNNNTNTLKMSRAVFLMSNKQDRFSSHIYEECKINHIKLLRHPHPQEWNDNKSKALKGRIINDEWRQKLSIAAKNRGMGHIDNTGRKLSQETKTKISTQVKSRKWWNNGVVDKMCPDCPGEGWVRGRLYTQRQNKRRSAT